MNEFTPEQLARHKAKLEAQRLERRREFASLVPPEFCALSLDKAPKPAQFKAVSEFLLDGGAYESDQFQDGDKCGLYLVGKTGAGKTAAAWALLDRGIEEQNWDYEFVKSTRFFRLGKCKHLGKAENTEFAELFNRMLNSELLIIDDIGSERPSEGTLETVFELLDTRTDNHELTILTSNLTIPELSRQFGRNAAKLARRLRQFLAVIDFDRP